MHHTCTSTLSTSGSELQFITAKILTNKFSKKNYDKSKTDKPILNLYESYSM